MDKGVNIALDKILEECGTDEKKWLKKLEKGVVNLNYAFTLESGESYQVHATWQCVNVNVTLVSEDGKDIIVH